MANSDDISGMRYEIGGSGPQGQGGKQNYVDPSLVPSVVGAENEHRLITQSGFAAAKFFGIVAGFAGLAMGGIGRMLFREGIPNGWKAAGQFGLIGLAGGSIIGFFTGKSVMRHNLRELHRAQAAQQIDALEKILPQMEFPPERTVAAPAVLQQAAEADIRTGEAKVGHEHNHTQGDCPACATGKIARGDTLGELAEAAPANAVSHVKEHVAPVKDAVENIL